MIEQSSLPLLAANKVLDEIAAIAATHQPPDKSTHDRLERAARKFIPIDAAFSYATLGALEAVSGNEKLMDSYHQNSIQLCDDPLMHLNYARSLYQFSRVREAAEQARIAASLADDDLDAMHDAISYTFESGGVAMAASLLETCKKLVPLDDDAYQDLIMAATVQKNTDITDEEIMPLVQIACDFLRAKQMHFVDQELIVDEEDEGFLSLCFNLNLPNDEVWHLNRQLFEVMLDLMPDQPRRLSVRFARSRAA